jgi:hypothetical protein
MKKFILFIALVSIYAISFGQLTDKEVIFENNSFSQVFETTVPPATQYLNAKQWIAKTFGSYKAVVQFEDESAHKIILKGQVIAPNDGIITETTWYQDKVTYSFTMTIDIKNGKYRVKIEDVTASVETKAVPKDNPMATPSLSNNEMSLEEYINWDKRSSKYAFLREMHFKQKIVPMLNSLVKDINIVDDF